MMTRSIVRFLVVAATTAVLLLYVASPAAALPPDFEEVYLAKIDYAVDLAFLPDGELLVAQLYGGIWLIDDPDSGSQPQKVFDIKPLTCPGSKMKMLSLAVHPDFKNNGYVYFYYTYFGSEGECAGGVSRVSRFVLRLSSNPVEVDSNSELRILDFKKVDGKKGHEKGDIAFGHDEYLYITQGDGRTDSTTTSEGVYWPQDLGTLHGKLVRLTDDGGIPPTNPYAGYSNSGRCDERSVPSPSGMVCQEIFAVGLRQTFRIALDPNRKDVTRFFLNDVGDVKWEEINEGGDQFPGVDYGWPKREGPCGRGRTSNCGFPSEYKKPLHWYRHRGGTAITGGAFVPAGMWPGSFDNVYLYADFEFGKIYRITPEGTGCPLCDPPTPGYKETFFADAARVGSMTFGPYKDTQALYYARLQDNNQGVYRISYVGSGANRAPTAVIDADKTNGPVGLVVTFDGTRSSDPDGDVLSYEWDFDGDGTVDSTGSRPTYKYTSPGTLYASLTVKDGKGGMSTDTVRIDINNDPPEPIIISPANGTTFAVGDVFTLVGSATDLQEGILSSDRLTWEVRQHHNTHWHPWLIPTQGNNIVVLPAPKPEDLFSANNSFLEILLTATDSQGLASTVKQNVTPKALLLDFDTVPTGLELKLDSIPITTPASVTLWENQNLLLEAPDQSDTGDSTKYSWVSWSDGGSKSHVIVVPSSKPETIVAVFGKQSRLTFTPTDDAYISREMPNKNFNSRTISVMKGLHHGMLRFNVKGINGASVSSVTLRLSVLNPSNSECTFFETFPNWKERTVTWENGPERVGTELGRIESQVQKNEWVEVDVTGLVKFDGPVSLQIRSKGEDGVVYRSKATRKKPKLVVNFVPPPPTTRVVALTPTDDATIQRKKGDKNYGRTSALRVGGNDLVHTLLRFDLSGIQAVDKAVLYLYAIMSSPFGGRFVATKTSSWSEKNVTWDNAPRGNVLNKARDLGSLRGIKRGEWYMLDVTKGAKSGKPLSIRILSNNKKGGIFCAKEHVSGKKPRLVVHYPILPTQRAWEPREYYN